MFRYKGQAGYFTDTDTDLIYCHHRYYDPVAGRWISRDPTGLDGGVNTYQYCGGRPLAGADPSGLDGRAALINTESPSLTLVEGGGKIAARVAVLRAGGLMLAAGEIGWAIGSAIDKGFGISEGVGRDLSAPEAVADDDPSYTYLKRLWLASDDAQRANLEEQYAFLNSYGRAMRSHPRGVHVHHLLPNQFRPFFLAAGLEPDSHEFLVPIDADLHRIIHGKGGGAAFEQSWNMQWLRFWQQYPTADAARIRRFLLTLRSRFDI